MQITTRSVAFDINALNNFWVELHDFFKTYEISDERKHWLSSLIHEHGYLPFSHVQALEELSNAEVIFCIQEKMQVSGTFGHNGFNFNEQSAVARRGIQDSSWIKTEQHNIKLVGLAALGDGNKSQDAGKFIDWLRQVLILPCGNSENGVLSTTLYLLPFHPREFGCAYLPMSSEVSAALEDENLKNRLGLDAKGQVKLFITLAQLCGHPVMYDILPQTARFSKIVLSNPHVARWFDVKQLINAIEEEIDKITDNNYVKQYLKDKLKGNYYDIDESSKDYASQLDEKLLPVKKRLSNRMLKQEVQSILAQRAKKIINGELCKGEFVKLSEDDIPSDLHGSIIGKLISEGLWPAPGGAWCSSGVPVFDLMSENAGFPKFRHFDFEDNDVTHFANLDCQTPYYFVYLENGSYNIPVIEFFINYMKNLQAEYNFDAFRVDHIDHIVDSFSEDESGNPISYRAPRKVLGALNSAMKEQTPYFATLAEYMLWDNFYKEYHQDMNFDLLWGNDVISQMTKTAPAVIEDNKILEEYNQDATQTLSILKAYNNQDGEFREIDQYPGQLSEAGALFKWFKFKFMPGGNLSQRPVLFIDGDEGFNKVGIESVIGAEISMKRENNHDFFKKFTAINNFALSNKLTRHGKACLLVEGEDDFVCWVIEKDESNELLLIVANQQPPTQKVSRENEDGTSEKVIEEGKTIENKCFTIPQEIKIIAKLEIEDIRFVEKSFETNDLFFERLNPSEFHVYKAVRN